MAANPNVYRFLRTLDGVEQFVIYTTSGVSTGDMVQWDPGSRVATNNLLASGSIFLGVANDPNPAAGLGTASQPLNNGSIQVMMQGTFNFKTTTGETYVHNTVVYQGADQQTITTNSASRGIGRVWLPQGTSITGASGVQCPVLILPNGYPVSMVAL